METQTVYKVVYDPYSHPTLKGKLISWQWLPEEWRVIYKPRDLTRPNIEGSQLFAFATLEAAAKIIAWRGLPEELWEAEGESPQPFSEVADPWSGLFIRRFWEDFNSGKSSDPIGLTYAPAGTVGCQSIRLVRRIDRSEYNNVALARS